jgi:hypothetical protein
MRDYRKWLQVIIVLVILAAVALLIMAGGCEKST